MTTPTYLGPAGNCRVPGRCHPGGDLHIVASHFLRRPSRQHKRKCLIQFGAPTHSVPRFATGKHTNVAQSLRTGPSRSCYCATGTLRSRHCSKVSMSVILVLGGVVGCGAGTPASRRCNKLSNYVGIGLGGGAGVIGPDVPWLECPACNALTWVIAVTE